MPDHDVELPDPQSPQRTYVVAPALGGIEALSAVYRSHRFPPHAQAAAVIGVVEAGEAVVMGAGERLSLTPGTVLVIPPHVLHEAESLGSDAWHYRALYLTEPQLAALEAGVSAGAGIAGTRPFVLSGDGIADQVLAVHAAVVSATEDSAPTLLSRLRSLVEAINGHVLAAQGEAPEDARVAAGIARVRHLLDTDPLAKRSLTEMARIAELSRFTFAHAFSRAYGVAPHAYAVQRRVAAVRDLLVAGELVSRAAHHVGFADQSHLTRRFLSVVGVTPGEFRRAWQLAQASTRATGALPDLRRHA